MEGAGRLTFESGSRSSFSSASRISIFSSSPLPSTSSRWKTSSAVTAPAANRPAAIVASTASSESSVVTGGGRAGGGASTSGLRSSSLSSSSFSPAATTASRSLFLRTTASLRDIRLTATCASIARFHMRTAGGMPAGMGARAEASVSPGSLLSTVEARLASAGGPPPGG